MVKHFLSIADYETDELLLLLEEAESLKKLYRRGETVNCLANKSVAMVFEKPSSRTRISFEVAVNQLGGSVIYIRPEDIGGLGKREPIRDLTRVFNGYVDMIVARTFAHESVEELIQYATMPVINALTDRAHPCQAMTDILTIKEHLGRLQGVKLAYIGDGNNVAASLALACSKLGLKFAIAHPRGYALADDFINQLPNPDLFMATNDPYQAVKDADIIYTDTWTSMGQEAEKQQRINDFAGFGVDTALVKSAGKEAKIMHCLPAYRGLEITDEVIESPQSIVFDQAENRLHFQRALIKFLMEKSAKC